ncbi:MAG: DUF1552 domain-containing protein [Lentisphaeraceae bacterium]|nr:DUF1552 domain-containing protein [Lentisphaeraceae bacterium]
MSNFNRRQFLKGAGTTLALPHLASLQAKSFSKEKIPQALPKMIFLSFGFGVTEESWNPSSEDTGSDYKLPAGLKPLAKHKKDFSIVQNTQHEFSNQGHWGSTFYLTGANPNAIPGKTFNNTVSVDQVAAKEWGENNRFSSMQFDSEPGNQGGHGPGLSLSWNQYGKPLPGLSSPFVVYNKLFGNYGMSIAERREMIRKKGSSLDVILMDAKRIQRKLNSADNDKLDEYFQSVREIEESLAKEQAWLGKPKPKAPLREPAKSQEGYQEIKLMYDLMAAAFQTDSTRVITYRLPADSFLKSLGITIGSHNLSHYKGFDDRHKSSELRDLKQAELLSYLFDKLKRTKGMDGANLFENTTISFGSNISTGHSLENCPAIVAGNTKNLRHGSHLSMPKETPLCNLWLTLLQGSGLAAKNFGDSTGVIDDLLA